MQPLVISLLSVFVAALPQGSANNLPVVKPWSPASSTDSRSPCPLLNTLANHGYLPHDGRNITAPDFGAAIHDALNFDSSFGETQANIQFQIIGKQIVDLEDLNAHELVEHRASLTRDDASSGDSLHLDPTRLKTFLADSDTKYVDVSSLIKSRIRVEALSGPPALPDAQALQSAGEAGLLLLAMADGELPATPANGTADYSAYRAPKDRLNAWFTKERLPVEFGWKPAPRQYVFSDVVGLAQLVSAGSQSA